METAEEITEELMKQIVMEVEQDSRIMVLPPLVVNELNKDLHGGSCLSRVTVSYTNSVDQEEHALTLILKVTPNIPSFSEEIKMSTLFPREIQMYEKILPRISSLLESAIPDRHTEFFTRVYFTRKKPSYLIAIHDLAPKGFSSPKRKNGLDLKHCKLALRMLARFHAASVMIHNEDSGMLAIFDEYSFQEEVLQKPMRKIANKICCLVSQVIESLPEFGPSWADRLRNRNKTWFDDLQAIWKRNDNAFNVLNHGDFGLHNLMFRHSDNDEVESIMFIDFQCCSYNSPVLDLHQFLFGSASEEVRANHINSLLTEYHAELIATLESLGTPREQTISLAQLIHEFDNKMLYGLFYVCSFLPVLNLDSDGDITADNLFDPDDVSFDKYKPLFTEAYIKTLKRLLPIFRQKELL